MRSLVRVDYHNVSVMNHDKILCWSSNNICCAKIGI